MNLRIKNTKITAKIIGWIQIIGGITGLGIMAYLLLNTGAINGALLLIFLIGICLFSFSIYSGRLLLNTDNQKFGLWLSAINFFLQLISFSIKGYGLCYCSGLAINIGIEGSIIKLSANFIKSNFSMSINDQSATFMITINLIALLALWVIADIYDEKYIKKGEKSENEIQVTSTAANIR